jgi:hypothetical protein
MMVREKRYVLCKPCQGGDLLFVCGADAESACVSDDLREARVFSGPEEALAFGRTLAGSPEGSEPYAVHEWTADGFLLSVWWEGRNAA